MEISSVMEILKHLPEGVSTAVILVAVLFTFLTKKKDVESKNMIAISELQTKQMTELISQNLSLSAELQRVRVELHNTYLVINEMRTKIVALEDLVKHRSE